MHGFQIPPEPNSAIDLQDGIQSYRDDERFLNCPRAFLVTGTPDQDKFNRKLLSKDQSGHWILKDGRVEKGDAIFLLLPSATGRDGYPRELFCGVLSSPPDRHPKLGTVIFQVKRFHRLLRINSEIKRFLGGRVPPQGDRVSSIWDDVDAYKKLRGAPGNIDENDEANSYPEGAKKFKQHTFKERNSKVVELAKARRFKLTGKLECEVCKFDFARVYGARGEGFIEAHHRVPISSINAPARVRIEDFELVCSNCHRMLHRLSPLMTAEALQNELNEN